jgi:hypothetical protein
VAVTPRHSPHDVREHLLQVQAGASRLRMFDRVGDTARSGCLPGPAAPSAGLTALKTGGNGTGMIERSRELAGSMPEVLLCDGPTGALDSQTGIRVLEALLKVHVPVGAKTLVITLVIAIAEIAPAWCATPMAPRAASYTTTRDTARRLQPPTDLTPRPSAADAPRLSQRQPSDKCPPVLVVFQLQHAAQHRGPQNTAMMPSTLIEIMTSSEV